MSALAEATADAAFRAPRSEAFLRWRLGNPARRYRVLAWHDSRLRGYLILAWTGRDPFAISVADYAAEDDGVLAQLLGAVARFQRPELALLDATLPRAHRSIAADLGFGSNRESVAPDHGRFLLYPLTRESELEGCVPPASSFPGSWRVGLLDTMAS